MSKKTNRLSLIGSLILLILCLALLISYLQLSSSTSRDIESISATRDVLLDAEATRQTQEMETRIVDPEGLISSGKVIVNTEITRAEDYSFSRIYGEEPFEDLNVPSYLVDDNSISFTVENRSGYEVTPWVYPGQILRLVTYKHSEDGPEILQTQIYHAASAALVRSLSYNDFVLE